MTWTLLQLDRRGSLNLPATLKTRFSLGKEGTSLALKEVNGVLVLVPLVGDAVKVYATHGDEGLHRWVEQQASIAYSMLPPPPVVGDKERLLRLKSELKMQVLEAQANLLRMKQETARVRAETLLASKADRNRRRYLPPVSGEVTPEEHDTFEAEQAAMLARAEGLPQASLTE